MEAAGWGKRLLSLELVHRDLVGVEEFEGYSLCDACLWCIVVWRHYSGEIAHAKPCLPVNRWLKHMAGLRGGRRHIRQESYCDEISY